MKICVIGCGRWGSFLAYYLHQIGHTVSLYGRPHSEKLQTLLSTRSNGLLTLPDGIEITGDLAAATADAPILVISINAQNLRALCAELSTLGIDGRTVVLCMKGIEMNTSLRLSEVATACLPAHNRIAVWLGPGHVQEMLEDVPNCMVLDSTEDALKKELADLFSSPLIRFYFGADLLGNEIGAATKNIIGIAAGMLDGFGLSPLKGALMSRGTREIARLIKALGGNELSAYGLCHLGDYQATVFSPFSNNRRFGEAFVRGEPYEKLAEGYYTVKPIMALGKKAQVDLPICSAIHDTLYEKKDAKQVLQSLFLRRLKQEM